LVRGLEYEAGTYQQAPDRHAHVPRKGQLDAPRASPVMPYAEATATAVVATRIEGAVRRGTAAMVPEHVISLGVARTQK